MFRSCTVDPEDGPYARANPPAAAIDRSSLMARLLLPAVEPTEQGAYTHYRRIKTESPDGSCGLRGWTAGNGSGPQTLLPGAKRGRCTWRIVEKPRLREVRHPALGKICSVVAVMMRGLQWYFKCGIEVPLSVVRATRWIHLMFKTLPQGYSDPAPGLLSPCPRATLTLSQGYSDLASGLL